MMVRRIGNIRDLSDFHLNWALFRPSMIALCDSGTKDDALTIPEREILAWLIELADRIGDADLPDPDSDDPLF